MNYDNLKTTKNISNMLEVLQFESHGYPKIKPIKKHMCTLYIYVCRVYMSPLAEKPANIFIRFNSSSLTMPGAGGGGRGQRVSKVYTITPKSYQYMCGR